MRIEIVDFPYCKVRSTPLVRSRCALLVVEKPRVDGNSDIGALDLDWISVRSKRIRNYMSSIRGSNPVYTAFGGANCTVLLWRRMKYAVRL